MINFLKKIGGAVTGKVEKMLLEYVPFDFQIDKMSAKNIIASVITYGIAELYLDYRNPELAELLKIGAAVIMADELEKEARGLTGTTAAPRAVAVPKAVESQVVIPKTEPKEEKGIIIA